jgi:molybdopterin converting factor subunit 1
MEIKILFFGITTDLIGASNLDFEISDTSTVLDFKNLLKKKHPQLENLDVYTIAVNEVYAEDDLILKESDVVAIIPPVSGG